MLSFNALPGVNFTDLEAGIWISSTVRGLRPKLPRSARPLEWGRHRRPRPPEVAFQSFHGLNEGVFHIPAPSLAAGHIWEPYGFCDSMYSMSIAFFVHQNSMRKGKDDDQKEDYSAAQAGADEGELNTELCKLRKTHKKYDSYTDKNDTYQGFLTLGAYAYGCVFRLLHWLPLFRLVANLHTFILLANAPIPALCPYWTSAPYHFVLALDKGFVLIFQKIASFLTHHPSYKTLRVLYGTLQNYDSKL